MRVMLAGLETGDYKAIKDVAQNSKYILSSYWYLRKAHKNKDLMDLFLKRNKEDKFMLDSGAFTAIEGNAKEVNFDEYIDEYICFINKYKIKRYLELDIDIIVGYKKVKEYRKKLENGVGYQCVPVWHTNRGISEWIELCKNYQYIAIGDLSSNDVIKRKHYESVFKMIDYAYQRGVKVHGLGFTKKEAWEKTKLYSVDSTSWTVGRRFGSISFFENGVIKATKNRKKENKRLRSEIIDKYNFNEWCKLQRYADNLGWKTFKRRFEKSLNKTKEYIYEKSKNIRVSYKFNFSSIICSINGY